MQEHIDPEAERERRDRLCKKLGLGHVGRAHQLIVESAHHGPHTLLGKGVRSTALTELGYNAGALRKLGYSDAMLEALGFKVAPAQRRKAAVGVGAGSDDPPSAPPAPAGSTPATPRRDGTGPVDQLHHLMATGMRAEGLLARGYNAILCKKAGYSAANLAAIGFGIHELRAAFPLPELKRAGYNAMDLRRYYSGYEMKDAGYSASELRNAGFSPRQLIGFGYSENAIITAGYSTVELVDAGLSGRTVDRRGLRR